MVYGYVVVVVEVVEVRMGSKGDGILMDLVNSRRREDEE